MSMYGLSVSKFKSDFEYNGCYIIKQRNKQTPIDAPKKQTNKIPQLCY